MRTLVSATRVSASFPYHPFGHDFLLTPSDAAATEAKETLVGSDLQFLNSTVGDKWEYSTLNSRILIIRTPKKVPLIFVRSQMSIKGLLRLALGFQGSGV